MHSRREILKKITIAVGMFIMNPRVFAEAPTPVRKSSKNILCDIFRAVNGTPDVNLVKIVEMMGGIEKIIGPDDVVVIKPNLQRRNQGAPNLSALKTFIDLIMERPGGFNGEVVVAENVHRGPSPWTSEPECGWGNHFERNSNIPQVNNMNDLSILLKKKYDKRFSICHWINVQNGSKRVFSPKDGTGYVYCDGTGGVPLITCDNGASGKDYRETIMTYPIFSTDKRTIIDFKNGVWERGSYTGQPLRFINFAALNHHSGYCGATSAIKNYLGVVDLSGGPDPYNRGLLTKNYYNFHSFPFNKWAPGPEPGMLGAEIGVFLKKIRKADLNITTAEWVGISSRIDPPIAHTRIVLACADPVALDYHATKYILFPNSKLAIHNPDYKESPQRQYLEKCSEYGGGIFDESNIGVKSYDFKTKALQKDNELVVKGAKKWGSNPKHIMKYLTLRYLS
jgi:hypothetical protein